MNEQEIENIEIDLLVSAICKRYGYDFSDYGHASLKRRIIHRKETSGFDSIAAMIPNILHDKKLFDIFMQDLSITVTELFRDPSFYKALREKIVPILKTFPFAKIWHAGCATGEEVYSMAIMLEEEGLLDRVQIYATDFNQHALEAAKEGVYPIKKIRQYMQNYKDAGGKLSLSEYFKEKYDFVKLDKRLRKNITFSHHNLATDGIFGEFNLILCRNVMIYFNRNLQNKVTKLFHDSLYHSGVLCLGSKETIDFLDIAKKFKALDKKEHIYKRNPK
jgi:chemotaxis protein methyltransferase CheR